MTWFKYKLEDRENWSEIGTLNYNTVLPLDLCYKREGKWTDSVRTGLHCPLPRPRKQGLRKICYAHIPQLCHLKIILTFWTMPACWEHYCPGREGSCTIVHARARHPVSSIAPHPLLHLQVLPPQLFPVLLSTHPLPKEMASPSPRAL